MIGWEVWVDIGWFGSIDSKGLKGLFVYIMVSPSTSQVSQHFFLGRENSKDTNCCFFDVLGG